MPRPITAKINVSKINKERLFKGKSGTYLDVVIWPNKQGADQYGNTHTIIQDIGKEARDRGEKGEIIGNLKMADAPAEPQRPAQQKPAQRPRPPVDPDLDPAASDSGIPF